MVAHLVRTSALATVSRTTALSVSSIQAEKEGLNSNEDNKNCLTKIQATMQTEQTLKGLADYAAGKYYQDKEFLAHFTSPLPGAGKCRGLRNGRPASK